MKTPEYRWAYRCKLCGTETKMTEHSQMKAHLVETHRVAPDQVDAQIEIWYGPHERDRTTIG